jgi:hypothetical protein
MRIILNRASAGLFTTTGSVGGASPSVVQDGQLGQDFQLGQLGELFFMAVANVHANLPATLHEVAREFGYSRRRFVGGKRSSIGFSQEMFNDERVRQDLPRTARYP